MKRFYRLFTSALLIGTIISPSVLASTDTIVSNEEVKPMGPDDPYYNMHWAWPTTDDTITDDYGDVGWRWHKGIDIGVYKKPVYSTASGEVIQSGHFSDGVTYAITIKHNDKDPDTGKNLITRYLHLEPGTLKFTRNEEVNKGTTIATSGTSGASGYHLHFDVNAKGMTYPGGTMTNFKKQFKLSDKEIKSILETSLSKEKKQAILETPTQR